MKAKSLMFLKRYFVWALLFGTLIGLNETLIANIRFPFRSVFVSAITIALLSYARLKIPQKGISAFIILIAILFKINNHGLSSCSTNFLLCGPLALILLGISYEIFSGILITETRNKFLSYSLTSIFTAFLAFSLFGVSNTFIINVWQTDRFFEFIYLNGSMTAVLSAFLVCVGIFAQSSTSKLLFANLNTTLKNSILGGVVIAIWLFGSLVKF